MLCGVVWARMGVNKRFGTMLCQAALVGLLLVSVTAISQSDMSAERRFADRASWVQLDLPPAWFGPRHALTARSGPDAAARQPGAAYWLSFDYLPDAADQPRQPLLRISVFPRATWMRLAADAPQGDLVVQTDTRVYLGMLAHDNPYAAGSEDAKRFEAMRFTPQALFDAFSIMGDAEGAKVRSSTIAKSAPQDHALAEGRLVCSGRDPAWTFVIVKGSNARFTAPDAKDAAAQGRVARKSDSKVRKGDSKVREAAGDKFQAMRGRMELVDHQAVWRGRAGKADDWVAVMRQASCDVAPQQAGSHAVLLSRPGGGVSQGCCRIAN